MDSSHFTLRNTLHNAVNPITLALTFLLLLALAYNQAEAKIYKWVDKNGVTQYTQYPPPEDTQVEEVKTQKQSAQAAAQAKEALQKRVDALDERRSDKKLTDEEGEEAVVERKKRDKFCSDSKARLAEFQSGRRLAQKQEDGSYVPITEEKRTEEVRKLQKRMKEQCN